MKVSLYNLTPDSAEITNVSAHPGGGTETIQTLSREGIVEDLYEAHMKNLEVAMKSNIVAKLASLSNTLDDKDLDVYSSAVDDILKKLAAQNQVSEILAAIKESVDKGLVDKYGPSAYYRTKTYAPIYNALDEINKMVLTKKFEPEHLSSLLSTLSSEEYMYGRMGSIGEIDLEDDLGAYFKLYQSKIVELAKAIENLKNSSSGPRAREVAEDMKALQDRADEISRMIKSLSIEAKSRGDLDPKEAERISQLYDLFDMTPLLNFQKLVPVLHSLPDASPQYKAWVTALMDKIEKDMGSLREAIFMVQ